MYKLYYLNFKTPQCFRDFVFEMESCFVNYLVKKDPHSENKKISSVTRTIKYSLDYTIMVSFFVLRYSSFFF